MEDLKMQSKKLLTLCCAAAMSTFGSAAFAADMVIGVPNWSSVRATAHVLKVVLEDNLGLEVERQNGTNPVVFEAMDSGAMHVHPEVWLPNQANLENKFVKEKKSVRQNPNGVNGDQAMCVTKSTAERIGIKDLAELSNPDMAKNFDSDGDGKGEIWIGAAGWASTNVEKIRAKSYGYAETMQLKEMDETLALAEVDNAVAQKKNIVFFCYTPHHMFALHELVILYMGMPIFDNLNLDEVGIKQAELLDKYLSNWELEAIYSSPLRRAIDTANIIARYQKIGVHIVEGLIDFDYGEWQSLPECP